MGVLQTLAIDVWIWEAHCPAQCLCSFEWTGLPAEKGPGTTASGCRDHSIIHVRLLLVGARLCGDVKDNEMRIRDEAL